MSAANAATGPSHAALMSPASKPDQISASYENGVLKLELPKDEPASLPASRQIEIR